MKKLSKRYLLILIGMCGLIATSVGLITNIAGLFFTPVAEEFGVLKGSVSLTLTISNLVFAAGGMVSPKLMNEKSFKKLLIIGTALIAGSTALLGFVPNLTLMYILNAVRGFAGGLLGFVFVTMVINNWFRASVGLATSIAMSFSGLAGALFSPVISAVIQSAGWRTGYITAAVMMAVMNLPAILFLPSLDPETKGMKPFGYEEVSEQKETVKTEQTSGKTVTLPLMIRSIIFALLISGATALPQHFPGISGAFGMSASVGALMLSICMIANSAGKIVLGAMIDKLGAKRSILIYSALVLTGILMIRFIHTPVTMYLGAGMYGLVYSIATVGQVTMTKDVYGLENYGKTYPTVSLSGTIANAIFSSAIGFLYDASGNYTLTLILMFAMVAVSVVLTLNVYRKKTV